MRVAVVHYHLSLGGVAQVIDAASNALTATGIQHVILTGEIQGSISAISKRSVIVEGLGYLTAPAELTAADLLVSMCKAANSALGGPPDIWHFHNHSLGKNILIAEVVASLAKAGERLVLQIHDLAESGRPENYSLIAGFAELYPVSPRVHYAFLNSRDLNIFVQAGLLTEWSSLLENPIDLPPETAPSPSPTPLIFAPIRGIRRKNLGELALLSALAPARAWFATSRAPTHPDALVIHQRWQKFSKRMQLPIEFDVVEKFAPTAGAGTDFQAWVTHATHLITTSVAEGFGLTFLEAIAHRKPLIGRNLPHLTADHRFYHIHTGNLYDQILIPVEWVDLVLLHDQLKLDLERNYRAYQRPLSKSIIDLALASLQNEGWLDFGNLPESLQQGVIERVVSDPANRLIPCVKIADAIQPATRWLEDAITNRVPSATPAQLAPYSLEAYQKNIQKIYQNLITQPEKVVSYIHPEKILTAHLTPEKFHFLLSALKPALPRKNICRAVIFDIYGTLLISSHGGVQRDVMADPILRDVLRDFGYTPPTSPSDELYRAVQRHHLAAGVPYPEIDLRRLWREILNLPEGSDTSEMVEALEAAWHPTHPMPGAAATIGAISRLGISLGLLSNAQSNTLTSLGDVADLFAPELTILSYQHGFAKPSPELFKILTDRISKRGILPAETLFVGNDPLQDIVPAKNAGFQTALFTGHPESRRDGECEPDLAFENWSDLFSYIRAESERLSDHS